MKRAIIIFLALSMCLTLITGCVDLGHSSKEDENTITIVTAPGRVDALLIALEEKFPDINFEIEYYVGDNTSIYLSEKIRHGDAGDIIFYTTNTSMDVDISQMLDLSGYPFVGNINDNILSMLDVDGHIYQIPGPLDVRCVIYNKTLFEERGWEVPTNFEEQLALIKQIRKEAPDVVPVTMEFLPAYSFVLPATLSQASFISTAEGYEWEQKYFKGDASFGEGFADGFTQVEQLVAAGAFSPEEYKAENNVNKQMLDGGIAMYYCWSGLRNFLNVEEEYGSECEFALLPFYGINDGDMVVGFNGSSMWSINKRLDEKGNEKKLENAIKIMEWIVSAEGQELIRKSRGQVPVTKDLTNYDPRIDDLLKLTQDGFMAYGAYTGYEHMLVEAGTVIQEAIFSGNTDGMRETTVELADQLNKSYIKDGVLGSYYGVLKEDISGEETAQLMANMLQSSGMGDFSLITYTGVKNGCINKMGSAGELYAGPVNDARILVINAGRVYCATTLEMTGAQVRELLEQGKAVYSEDETITTPEYFDYYWSGLDVTMKDNKVISMKLNGAELKDEQSYTVVFAENDYPQEYTDKVVISEILVSDIMKAYMEKNSEISAPEVLRK